MDVSEMVHIAIGVHDLSGEYCRHAAALLASIFMNTKASIRIHFLHDVTLTKENRQRFISLVNSFHQEIVFYDIKDAFPIVESETLSLNTVGTLFRLMLPDLVNVDKMIYFDCDVICSLDVKEMWKIDLGNYAIAAVSDSPWYISFAQKYDFYRKVPILGPKYFNAGVLILNLTRIREKYRLFDDCLALLQKYPDAPCLDQDALNTVFLDDCLLLDSRYNKLADDVFVRGDAGQYTLESSWAGICWHFAGKEKPWNSKLYPVFLLYWRSLARTPWANTPEQLVNWMYMAKDGSLDRIMLTQEIANKKDFVFNFVRRFVIEFKKYLWRKR